MPAEYNPIFEKIFERVQQDGDEIIAYIAYGLYKERKRDFLISRQAQLACPVQAKNSLVFPNTVGRIDDRRQRIRPRGETIPAVHADEISFFLFTRQKISRPNDQVAEFRHVLSVPGGIQ